MRFQHHAMLNDCISKVISKMAATIVFLCLLLHISQTTSEIVSGCRTCDQDYYCNTGGECCLDIEKSYPLYDDENLYNSRYVKVHILNYKRNPKFLNSSQVRYKFGQDLKFGHMPQQTTQLKQSKSNLKLQ